MTMKITRIHAWPVELHLVRPYTISYETIEKATNVFVRIETDAGIAGSGCAAPDLPVTGETSDTVLDAIDNRAAAILCGADPLRWALLVEQLRAALGNQPSARAALDMAVFDIVARKADMPLWKMLGGYRDSIETSVTIGIMSTEETVAAAREWAAKGFRCLKIKGGRSVDEDVDRVLKVREAVGDGAELRFDANQGFNVRDALLFVQRTRAARLELLEQPTPSGEPELLGAVTRAVPIPVMADESLITVRDAFRLARNEFVDMVNIKLMKVGGIADALHANSVARAAGLEVMVSCMDEAGLAVAAGLNFALARPNVAYADLDGHLEFTDDPTRDAVMIRDGYLIAPAAPGLGFELPPPD